VSWQNKLGVLLGSSLFVPTACFMFINYCSFDYDTVFLHFWMTSVEW
jgi:hypothetical protein